MGPPKLAARPQLLLPAAPLTDCTDSPLSKDGSPAPEAALPVIAVWDIGCQRHVGLAIDTPCLAAPGDVDPDAPIVHAWDQNFVEHMAGGALAAGMLLTVYYHAQGAAEGVTQPAAALPVRPLGGHGRGALVWVPGYRCWVLVEVEQRCELRPASLPAGTEGLR